MLFAGEVRRARSTGRPCGWYRQSAPAGGEASAGTHILTVAYSPLIKQ